MAAAHWSATCQSSVTRKCTRKGRTKTSDSRQYYAIKALILAQQAANESPNTPCRFEMRHYSVRLVSVSLEKYGLIANVSRKPVFQVDYAPAAKAGKAASSSLNTSSPLKRLPAQTHIFIKAILPDLCAPLFTFYSRSRGVLGWRSTGLALIAGLMLY